MASTNTTIVTKPLMRPGHNSIVTFKTRSVVAGSDLVAGTALMYDASSDTYIEADTDTITSVSAVDFTGETVTEVTSTNLQGWCILGEDADTGTADKIVYTTGAVDSDDVVLKGSTLTAMTEEAKVIFAMNGIEISQSKLD